MKFFVSVERAFRRFRDNIVVRLVVRLRNVRWFQNVTLLALQDQVVLVTKQFDDHRLTFSPYEFIGKSLFREGHYQRDLADKVLSIIGKPGGSTLLEIGANIGTHTVYLTRSAQFERVICVEPEPRNLQLLRQNLALNDLADRTTVVECAVGAREGVADFYFDVTNFGASSLINRAGSGTATKVSVRRVDTILRDLDIDPDEIGLVWMDIEGAEPDAIISMASLVDRRVPIVIEYAPHRYDVGKASEMANYLYNHYGRCIALDTSKDVDIRALPHDGQFDILLLP